MMNLSAFSLKIADRLGISDEKLEELTDWAEMIAPANPERLIETQLRDLELAQHGSVSSTTLARPLAALV